MVGLRRWAECTWARARRWPMGDLAGGWGSPRGLCGLGLRGGRLCENRAAGGETGGRGRAREWSMAVGGGGQEGRHWEGEAFGIRHQALGKKGANRESRVANRGQRSTRSSLQPAAARNAAARRKSGSRESRVGNRESGRRSARSSLQPAAARKRLRRGRRCVGRSPSTGCAREARAHPWLHPSAPRGAGEARRGGITRRRSVRRGRGRCRGVGCL
jgi:hypothetical protein